MAYLKREEVECYIREVGKETALHLLRQLGLIPIEAHFEPFAEAPIESFAEAPIESFTEALIEAPIEAVTEAPIEAVAEVPVVEFFDKTFVEAPIEAIVTKAFTKSVAQNLATTSCSGMATKSLSQAKYLVKTAPFVRLGQHTRAAVFVFDPGGTNTSIRNHPAVIPRFF